MFNVSIIQINPTCNTSIYLCLRAIENHEILNMISY